MVSHAQAAEWARDGYTATFGVEPSDNALLFMLAVALGESGYGQGWKGDGIGSNNMGAIQAGLPPCNPDTSFQYTDTSPQPSGQSKPYEACFRKYATPTDGMADIARVLYQKRPKVLDAAERGDCCAMSRHMYDTHYYEGMGSSREKRIRTHAKGLAARFNIIAKNLGYPQRVDGCGADVDATLERAQATRASEAMGGTILLLGLIGLSVFAARKARQ